MEDTQALIKAFQEQLLLEVKDFAPLGSHFALTLGVSRGGQLFCSTQTHHWLGWPERNPRWEIRTASAEAGATADGTDHQ